MLVKALLVAIWAGLCSLDDGGIQLQIRKPLLAGTVTGLILGDLKQGLIIGGTLELMWLGVNSVGAYNPPDITGGAIIGTVAGITSCFLMTSLHTEQCFPSVFPSCVQVAATAGSVT